MYLGLDLGTSGLRGILTDADGVIFASAEASYDVKHPQKGWSEQHPSVWLTACAKVTQSLQTDAPERWRDLAAIGVSGHMHGAVLLDQANVVLRPCILWNDTRSHIEAAELDSLPDVRRLSGNIVFPGFTAPKLLWLARHEPDTFERVAKVLLPSAYLNFWLTGEYACGLSDAAGTSWLDCGARDWSPELLSAGSMDTAQMPDVVEGVDPIGQLRPELAREWGVRPSVQVVGGAGDNAAAACGAGILKAGQGFVSLGTSGVLLTANDRYAPDPATALHTFCHAVPDRWYQMGVILAATDSLNWLSRVVGVKPAALTAALGDQVLAPGDAQFLPYLSGERTPHNDGAIRGAFIGLDISADQTDLTRAVLAGVAYALRDSFEAMSAIGAAPDDLLAIGGGAASRYWIEMIATVLNTPLKRPVAGEFGAALGAARLAIVGATGAPVEDVMTPPEIAETIDPVLSLTTAYDDGYAQYQRLYPALKALQAADQA